MIEASLGAGRADYAVAGAAGRTLIERVLTEPSSGMDLRVALALLHALTTWSRTDDRIATRALAGLVFGVPVDEVTGWQRRKVSNSLVGLARRGMIRYRAGRGRGSIATISITSEGAPGESPCYPQGDRISDTFGYPQGDPCETPSAVKVSRSVRKGVRQEWHTEKYSEEKPSRAGAGARAHARREPKGDDDGPGSERTVPPFDEQAVTDLAIELQSALVKPGPITPCTAAVRELLDAGHTPDVIRAAIADARRHGDVRTPGWIRTRITKQSPAPTDEPAAATVACSACSGLGLEEDAAGDYGRCSACRGRGSTRSELVVQADKEDGR